MSSYLQLPNYRRLQSILAAMLAGTAIAAAAATLNATTAAAADLIVKYDQSQLIRMPRRVAEVVIGNPTIADVAVQSGNLLVVTGKTFGVTNFIALDSEKQVIVDQRIVVTQDGVRTVNLVRGSMRQSYNCTPSCNPSLTVGDEKSYFDYIAKSGQAKVKFADSVADNKGGNQ